MAWVLLDDNFPSHPKVVQAGNAAAFLFVCGLCYCRRFHTEGFIPTNAAKNLGVFSNPRRLIDALIEVGLWERAEGGFMVHDYAMVYADDAGDKAKKEETRKKRQEAGRRGGLAKASKVVAIATPFATPFASGPAVAHTSMKDWSGSGSQSLEERKVERREPEGDLDLAFNAFRDAYPAHRRQDSHMLRTMFCDQAWKCPDGVAGLMAALHNHKLSEQWQTPKLVPGMEKWLEKEYWRQRMDPPKQDGASMSKWEASLPEWAQKVRAAKAVQS
jgi:hypothetical protein